MTPPFFPPWATDFWETHQPYWSLVDQSIDPAGIGSSAEKNTVWTVRPPSMDVLAQLIHQAQRASGTLYVTSSLFPFPSHSSCLTQHAAALDLSALQQVTEWVPADFVVGVETGMTLGALNEHLASHGQQFPLMYPQHWTLADVLASDLPAVNTGSRGMLPRDIVLGLTVITPDGDLTRCGGKVMKNVTGYDLNKLYCGAQHTLGLMVHSFLKLDPVPEQIRSFIYPMESLEDGVNQGEILQSLQLPGLRVATLIHRSQLPAPWIERYELLDETQLVLWVELAGMAQVVESSESTLTSALGPGFILSEEDRQGIIGACYPAPAQCQSPVMACLEVRVAPVDIADVLATWLALCPEGKALVPWVVDLLDGGIYLPVTHFEWPTPSGLEESTLLEEPPCEEPDIFQDTSHGETSEDSVSNFMGKSLPILEEFQRALHKLGGFYRVCAVSSRLLASEASLAPWIRRWNLPEGATVAMWMDRLKETMDSRTVFPSILLPLGTRYQTLDHEPHLV